MLVSSESADSSQPNRNGVISQRIRVKRLAEGARKNPRREKLCARFERTTKHDVETTEHKKTPTTAFRH